MTATDSTAPNSVPASTAAVMRRVPLSSTHGNIESRTPLALSDDLRRYERTASCPRIAPVVYETLGTMRVAVSRAHSGTKKANR
jgi:hypothetical protein